MRCLLPSVTSSRLPGYLACAALFAWAAALPPCLASTQIQAPAQAPAQAQAPVPALPAHVAQANRASGKTNTPPPKTPVKRQTKPLWNELTPAQQQALAPLAGTWETVSVTQKRKWIALSQNFPMMSGAEQAKLHSRMTDWVALSPQQRTQARLNFGQTQQLAPRDKKAQWEAYQALSPEEKRKLAAKAPKPPAAAAAVKPVAPDKLAGGPKGKHKAHKSARIAAGPNQVDHNTLLPQQAAPAPAPVN